MSIAGAHMKELTLIVPYYRNPQMLKMQVEEWNQYPAGVRIIVVDDGSPEPAYDVILEHADLRTLRNLHLFRIKEDIPWNRGGARNLGATLAMTRWLMHIDIDHLMPWQVASLLLQARVDAGKWYRFNRYRLGKADATRRKDKIPEDVPFGLIHPHIDSYVITRDMYWEVGGYDEDYSGCLGGGSPFLKQLDAITRPAIFNEPIRLLVVTRDACPDASDLTLDRSSEEYTRRRKDKERRGATKATRPLRFKWEQLL